MVYGHVPKWVVDICSLCVILYPVVGLALLDLGLQRLHLELGLLQFIDTLTRCTLILVEMSLLLLDQILK